MTNDAARRRAFSVVLAFGLVSLFADVVYEGARSILGPYLLTLGASATAVGTVAGAGEFAGYGLRVLTGWAADRFRSYWTLTIAGYTLTVVAVPLLGWAGRVDLALALVVAERLGKAIRSPARDALLAEAVTPLGRGWGFGLHEALDQTGAIAGPLLLAAVLAARSGDYRLAFGVLAVPGVLALLALVAARQVMGSPAPTAPVRSETRAPDGLPVRYLAFVALSTLGFAPFPLIAYHLVAGAVTTDARVPILFAVAMAVDGGVALLAGRRYDRRGMGTLLVVPLLSAASLAAFAGHFAVAVVGVAAWGAALGIQESTLRAAVGDLVSSETRATAYGIFNAVYGFSLLGGGVALGRLSEMGLWPLAAVVSVVEAAAVATLIGVLRLARRGGPPTR